MFEKYESDRIAPDQLHTPVQTKPCCAPKAPRGAQHSSSLTNLHEAAGAAVASPQQMISLPGGEFLMGTDYAGGFPADGEGPVRRIALDPFQIDATPVTNAAFSEFVNTTGYVTEAETFGWSFVFWSHLPVDRFHDLVEDTVAAAPWWCKVPGASWKQPSGPGSDLRDLNDHPVVHVSWHDAAAFAKWAGKRLPTEAEWEFAARGGLEQKLFPWGDELTPGGRHFCNVWQGGFPTEDTAEDGYAGTCPVRAFPPNDYGLYSVAGNVWEWCADWFSTNHVPELRHNPMGPATGTGKIMKGGSFLCHASYCNRYRVAARTENTPDSSTSNIGFRCAATNS
ncbi:MAG TPA: formylglycine-generating enzyme family protein [Edaphobacter sp.]